MLKQVVSSSNHHMFVQRSSAAYIGAKKTDKRKPTDRDFWYPPMLGLGTRKSDPYVYVVFGAPNTSRTVSKLPHAYLS